jgi:hypothetical protein
MPETVMAGNPTLPKGAQSMDIVDGKPIAGDMDPPDAAAMNSEQLVDAICTNDGVSREQARRNIQEFEAAFASDL